MGRIEGPRFTAGGRIERHYAHLRGGRVQDSVDDDRIRLHLGIGKRVVGVIAPRELELRDVGWIDLRKRGVADVVGSAVYGPIDVSGVGGVGEQGKEGKKAFHDF